MIAQTNRCPFYARSPRYAVRLCAHIRDATGEKTLNVTTTWLVDLGQGGARIEWPRCKPCQGYEPGGVHPQCVLKPFDNRMRGSRDLSLCIDLPDGRSISARGKVAHVFQAADETVEELGLKFTAIEAEDREVLE